MSRPADGWAADSPPSAWPPGTSTEAQLRNLFGEKGRHPHADRLVADRLAKGESPKKAWKAGALGRRVTVSAAPRGR